MQDHTRTRPRPRPHLFTPFPQDETDRWLLGFLHYTYTYTHTNVRGGGGRYLVVGIWKRDRGGVTHNEPDENPLSTAITSKAKHRLTTFAKCGEWGTVERNKQEILNERTATFNCLCSTHTHEDICISYVRSLLSKLKNVGGSNTTN